MHGGRVMSNYEESSFLGGGEAYIGIYDVNMNLQGEFDIGNVKSFTIEAPSIEKKNLYLSVEIHMGNLMHLLLLVSKRGLRS